MNFLKLLSIILCIALPLPAFAQKAKTIDELGRDARLIALRGMP